MAMETALKEIHINKTSPHAVCMYVRMYVHIYIYIKNRVPQPSLQFKLDSLGHVLSSEEELIGSARLRIYRNRQSVYTP